MFDNASNGPRVFGVDPGADFPRAVLEGLLDRVRDRPPEALARVQVLVNTRRMQRRLKALFDDGPARLLPRIRLVTDLSVEAALSEVPPPVPPLRRRLDLMRLVSELLTREPHLAPRSAAFGLADSLAALMEEMGGEGVTVADLEALEIPDSSGHWQRSLRFVRLVARFLDGAGEAPDTELRQRLVVERLVRDWQSRPPTDPVLVAGSTGSRGATALLMQAVARLPQGAVILPGFDFDMPLRVWEGLDDARTGEDHPQFRFARLLRQMDLCAADVARWSPGTVAPQPERNRLISLALRPAPVTDQWMEEGARLQRLDRATERLTLVEAPSVRAEAGAIALVLRDALSRNKIAALITPDRVLTRQVTAALERWGIRPDDSGGRPLPLTAPGRFLRHVATLFAEPLTVESLLTVLKHPLTHSTAERGPHLLHTRDLELSVRRYGPPFPTPDDLRVWSAKGSEARSAWANWLAEALEVVDVGATLPLDQHLTRHLSLSVRLAAGPGGEGAGGLWEEEAGQEALRWVEALRQVADAGAEMSARDYCALLDGVLQRGNVRERFGAHPRVMIWGTLEARVQGADVVVLGGLNEGTWPDIPAPDPWMNRELRLKAGLLLPERRIGLAAHDFQQAVAAPEAVLTRSVRSAEAQTVPARWLNRLCNLMSGLSAESAAALQGMRARGDRWLRLAEAMEHPARPASPAPRPCPCPPVTMRPRQLSITEIQTLIRDPYAIYARHVLGLRRLDPLRQAPDAPLRGTVLHKVLERFVKSGPVTDASEAVPRLLALCDEVLRTEAPWPAAQRLWRARLARVADWFVAGEIARQAAGEVLEPEMRGHLRFPGVNMTLAGKVDRIDRGSDQRLTVYDYKTGSPPNGPQQEHFDKQLALAALMVEAGALEGLDAARVAATVYIGLGGTPQEQRREWSPEDTAQTRDEFLRLIAAYALRERGYTSRRAPQRMFGGADYDHLARFGEWDGTAVAQPQRVGPCD